MEIVLLMVIGTSIWVVVDAKSLGFGKRAINNQVDSGPWTWFFACLLLWIVAFPIYLVKRSKYKREPETTASTQVPTAALAHPGPPALGDALVQLEKLAELKDRGIISEEEFAAKKRQLLG